VRSVKAACQLLLPLLLLVLLLVLRRERSHWIRSRSGTYNMEARTR
jgi:hypothetical protein